MEAIKSSKKSAMESNIEMWQNYAKKGDTRSSQGSRTRMKMLKDKGFKKFTGPMAASSSPGTAGSRN